ncbi:MAG: hypothetical protein ACR2QK_22605 [Acidimicrobiales bacterium]
MNRIRPNTRIRPIRPYWSRTTLVTVFALSTLVLLLVATAWLQRSERRLVELDPTGPYRLRSNAGPIEVAAGEAAILRYDASWLLFGPDAGPVNAVGAGEVDVRCGSRFPCRASSRLELPSTAELEVEASGGDVSVEAFAGRLSVTTAGRSDVVLGPVGGSVEITTEIGAVHGYGLTADEVEIDTTSGEIELRFAARPDRLVVRSGSEPVTIELPDGDYAVSVRSGSSIAINVGQVSSADSQILVQARGPVRIDPIR